MADHESVRFLNFKKIGWLNILCVSSTYYHMTVDHTKLGYLKLNIHCKMNQDRIYIRWLTMKVSGFSTLKKIGWLNILCVSPTYYHMTVDHTKLGYLKLNIHCKMNQDRIYI